MEIYRHISPPYFKGLTLNKDTAVLVPDEEVSPAAAAGPAVAAGPVVGPGPVVGDGAPPAEADRGPE
jgi:hypothetical protein